MFDRLDRRGRYTVRMESSCRLASPSLGLCVCVCVSVCLSVCWSGKYIVPLGMVSGVGRGMGVLDGGGDHRRLFWGEFGVSHCNQWGLCCVTVVRERRTLPKLLWGGLVLYFGIMLLLIC